MHYTRSKVQSSTAIYRIHFRFFPTAFRVFTARWLNALIAALYFHEFIPFNEYLRINRLSSFNVRRHIFGRWQLRRKGRLRTYSKQRMACIPTREALHWSNVIMDTYCTVLRLLLFNKLYNYCLFSAHRANEQDNHNRDVKQVHQYALMTRPSSW